MLEAQLNDHTEVSCLDLLFSLSLAPSLIMVHFSCGRLNILAMYLLKKYLLRTNSSLGSGLKTVDIMVSQRVTQLHSSARGGKVGDRYQSNYYTGNLNF